MIKIITLTGLILLGLIIDLGGVPGESRIGFRYWKGGKAFKPYKRTGDLGAFLGFVNALVLALFAYIGTELIGVTVGEAKVRVLIIHQIQADNRLEPPKDGTVCDQEDVLADRLLLYHWCLNHWHGR